MVRKVWLTLWVIGSLSLLIGLVARPSAELSPSLTYIGLFVVCANVIEGVVALRNYFKASNGVGS